MLYSTGSSVRFTIPGAVPAGKYYASVQARGENYLGWPTLALKQNGAQVGLQTDGLAVYSALNYNSLTLKPGDTLDAVFTNDLYGGANNKDRNIAVDYLTLTPVNPSALAGFSGIADGASVSGTINPGPSATLTNGQSVTSVNLQVTNAGGTVITSNLQKTAPHCLGGDNGVACNAWDTTKFPNGAYTLSAMATRTDGSTSSLSRAFTISNTAAVIAPPTPAPVTLPPVPAPVTPPITTNPGDPTLPFVTGLTGNWYVDANVTSSGNGSSNSPFKTISAAVNAATGGQTIVVRAGVYRESVLLTRGGITLLAETGAVIDGANPMNSGWTNEGAYWSHPYTALQQTAQAGGWAYCKANTGNRCLNRDQVFLDGAAQTQDTSLSGLASGHFYAGYGKLYLRNAPAGHDVEVGARTTWLSAPYGWNVGSITVKGFTMRHAVNEPQTGALNDGGGAGWVFDGNDLGYAHGVAVKTDGSNAIAKNNLVHDAGQLGMSGAGFNMLVQNNKIYRNNAAGFDPGWEAGGTKWTMTQKITVSGNEAYNNDGPGLWTDVYVSGAVFNNNRLHDNTRQGIHIELSRNVKVYGNTAWNNGSTLKGWSLGSGILIENSNMVEVNNNLVAWNGDGIGVIQGNRGSDTPTTQIFLHDNTVAASQGVIFGVESCADNSVFLAGSNVKGWNNHLYATGTTKYSWNGVLTSNFATFQATPIGVSANLIDQATLLGQLTSAGMPTTGQ